MESAESRFDQHLQRFLSRKNRLLKPPPPPSKPEGKFTFPQCHLSKPEKFSDSLQPGMMFELVVVDKCDKEKQLVVYVWKYKPEADGKKPMGRQLGEVGCYGLKGIIRDYEIKQDFSIFGYCQSYKIIVPGCHLNAVFVKTFKREEELIYEFSLRNNLLGVADRHGSTLGMISNTTDPAAIQYFNKHGCLPLDYQILHDQALENPNCYNLMASQLKVDEHGTLSGTSNKPVLQELGLHFQRVRKTQNRRWANEYMDQGLSLLRRGAYADSIECFNLSIKFDEDNPNVYAAKGCALANTKNLNEGLRCLKRALAIDPNNKMANDYYQKVRDHMELERQNNRDGSREAKKNNLVPIHKESQQQYKMIHKK